MAAAEQKTNLRPPPEYRGGGADAYVYDLFRWAQLYNLTLEPLVQQAMQLKADIDALGQLTQTVSNPPTQDEVTAIQNKVNAIIGAAGA